MKYFFLIAILLLGPFFRAYQPVARFNYAHDSDLASWMVKDMIVDGHIRLIGQLTSAPGIFIGPFFYYSLVPFYLIGNFDPLPSVAFSWLIGILSLLSCFAVIAKIHGRKPAFITTFLYAVSFAISLTEREVVPTTPVILWTIWAYYAIHRRNPIIIAILLALVWHINLALILLTPIFVISLISNYKNISSKLLIFSFCIFILISAPLILFESRHNFNQTRALFTTLSSIGQNNDQKPVSLSAKISHVFDYADKNLNNNIFSDFYKFPKYLFPSALILIAFFLAYKKRTPKYFPWLILAWQLLFVIFFTLHPINLSEYYLNGMNIIWLIILGLFLANTSKFIYLTLLTLYLFINLSALFVYRPTSIGYLQKKQLIEYIRVDSQSHGYPCISISYMTDIGYNFGYRYFFYLANLHVNQPKSGSPVYTIVFPHSRANRIDKSFGALGLINPDYSKYNMESVKLSCSGENSNLTDPMFGFTN